MRLSIVVFALALVSGSLPASACDFLGGTMPGICPPEATRDWWNGGWASRESDGHGGMLTALARLKADSTYASTIVLDDGNKIEEWGHYEISVSRDLGASFKLKRIVDPSAEAADIDTHLRAAVEKSLLVLDMNEVAIVKEPRPEILLTLTGEIAFFPEGNSTQNVDPTPERYRFITQGEDLIRITGSNADNLLVRKY